MVLNIRIHLFRDRKSNININRIYEFFDADTFRYSQTDKYVNFKYVNKAIDNKASFVFVKHNVISEIYELSSAYTNLNMFIEFPMIISDFHLNEIMEIVDRLTHKFGLYYFLDLNKDITVFNKKEVFEKILDYRDKMTSIEEITKSRGRIVTPGKKLYEICTYQNAQSVLDDYFKGSVDVNPYIVMKDVRTDELALSVEWHEGRPTIFPKHIDYIHIYFDGLEVPSIVPAKVVMDQIHRFLALLPNFVDGTRILKPGTPTKKASKLSDKWKSIVEEDYHFDIVTLASVIDERNQQ